MRGSYLAVMSLVFVLGKCQSLGVNREVNVSSSVSGRICLDLIVFFLKYFMEFISEATQDWSFLCGKHFNENFSLSIR